MEYLKIKRTSCTKRLRKPQCMFLPHLIRWGDATVGSTLSDTVINCADESWAVPANRLYTGSLLICCCSAKDPDVEEAGTGGNGPFLVAEALLASGTGDFTAEPAMDSLMALNLVTR